MDKVKRLVVPVAVIVLVLLSLVNQAQSAVQGLAQLPDEGRLLVLSLVTAAVTWALLQISKIFGIDFSGYATAIAAVLAPLLITVIEGYLNLIPRIFDNLVLSVIHLLVLLIGSVGALLLLKKKAVPTLKEV